MDLQLTGRRAIITGGAGGLGLPVAHALAAEGVDVVLAGRTAETLEAAAAEVAARSGRAAYAVVTDVRDDAAVRALVDRTVELLGGVDILVNSASDQSVGRGMPGLAGTTDDIFWDDVDTKLVGYLRTARAVAPHLVAQGWGRIVNIGGLGARETRSIVRSVRNVGVAALTKNLAEELGPLGVNVTVVHPGLTRTEGLVVEADQEVELAHNQLRRLVTAEEVADVVAFLASPRSVSIQGDAVGVGGGASGVVHY